MSSFDVDELFDVWDDLNFTGLLENGTRVAMGGCSATFDRSALLYTTCVLYVFIFVVGLAANGLVLWVNIRAQGTSAGSAAHPETHLYIAQLAAADLCVCATLPVWVSSLAQQGHWPFGETACKVTHLLFSVNLFGSIFFLACMSVDRYLSVTWPSDGEEGGRRRRRTRRAVCAGVWLLALVASLPDTYFLRAVKSSHGDVVLCRPVYPEEQAREWMVGIQLSFILLGFALPFPVIALAYALLARALSSSSSPATLAVEQERRVSRRVILAYIVVFLGCWVPYHGVLLADALSLLGLVPLSCGLENAVYVALHLTQCLSLLHCCFNPILYNFINRNYRYDLMKAFIFKYSTRTGLARLIEQTHHSETEYSAVAVDNPPKI
ncbi:atypical chemokine receptor 3 [Esox lucius]|uniref:G-protein coupled receptors family 1 profile domain-containing protein n=1 Tax=Esox lucius TaxID=8010 RepID=A0AAY5KSJ7_ESOLU|nr:atypical chemokine receptor 3 [Esox lucius]